jgi:hypothetical protein
MASGQCLRNFAGHTAPVQSVCFSADGRWVLSGSTDHTMRLWEVASGRCLRTFEGHAGWVSSVCLSADRRWALSGSTDHTMRLWEVASGRCLHIFEEHGDVVYAVDLSADGCWAVSGSWDYSLRLWQLDWDLEAHGVADWDEGARPQLEAFLTLHTPYSTVQAPEYELSATELSRVLTRTGPPQWTDQDFQRLIQQLRYAGFGWLRKEGVERALKCLGADWQGPPPLPPISNAQQHIPPDRPESSGVVLDTFLGVIWVGPPS